jgi:hypothetical protein
MGENLKDSFSQSEKEMSYNLRAIIVICILLFANISVFILKFDARISGLAVAGVFEEDPKMDISRIIFILQWIALIAVVIFLYLRHLKNKKSSVDIDLSEFEKFKNMKSGTDMDVLYSVLEYKEELPLSTIQKLFNINKDNALKWCKILEEHSLASINYPAFSEPILRKK